MNFYWVYDLPNWLFAVMTILFFVLLSVSGLIFFRKSIQRTEIPQSHNDIVSFYMAGLNAIYGITLGLIAVGAWQNFSDVDLNVSKEASAVAATYQDVANIQTTLGDSLRAQLKEYTEHTIKEDWPLQRKGILPANGTKILAVFQKTLSKYEPATKNQEIVLTEVYNQFNKIIELRKVRLQNVTNGLPAAIWEVIFFGAMLNIIITWFFITDKLYTHILMSVLFAALLGSLVFLVAAMDNPFRGEFSVGSDAFELVMETMKG